jgi:hypothetical protein
VLLVCLAVVAAPVEGLLLLPAQRSPHTALSGAPPGSSSSSSSSEGTTNIGIHVSPECGSNDMPTPTQGIEKDTETNLLWSVADEQKTLPIAISICMLRATRMHQLPYAPDLG